MHTSLVMYLHLLYIKGGIAVGSRISAIVVAGGKGTRMKRFYNKQYILLDSKPIIAHTLMNLERCSLIEEIILVVAKGEVGFCEESVVENYRLKKIKKVIEGGTQRYDSVYNGLQEIGKDIDVVLIHDGARPFISDEIIERSIKGLEGCDGVVVGVPVKDTIKRVSADGMIQETLKRQDLWQVQTPQVFPASQIKEAHEMRKEKNLQVTDDAMLLEILGKKVKMVMGDNDNFKMTTPEDLDVGKAILKKKQKGSSPNEH